LKQFEGVVTVLLSAPANCAKRALPEVMADIRRDAKSRAWRKYLSPALRVGTLHPPLRRDPIDNGH
jgi:hypothetical protein